MATQSVNLRDQIGVQIIHIWDYVKIHQVSQEKAVAEHFLTYRRQFEF